MCVCVCVCVCVSTQFASLSPFVTLRTGFCPNPGLEDSFLQFFPINLALHYLEELLFLKTLRFVIHSEICEMIRTLEESQT